jgi:hypothetical protein
LYFFLLALFGWHALVGVVSFSGEEGQAVDAVAAAGAVPAAAPLAITCELPVDAKLV